MPIDWTKTKATVIGLANKRPSLTIAILVGAIFAAAYVITSRLNRPSQHPPESPSSEDLSLALTYGILAGIAGLALTLWHEYDRLRQKQLGKLATGPWGVMRAVPREVGMALMVAAVITVVFEYTVRGKENAERKTREKELEAEYRARTRELEAEHRNREKELDNAHRNRQKELERDVFSHIIGHDVDKSIMGEVNLALRNSMLVRSDVNATYEFSQAKPDTDQVRVVTSVRYRLTNRSRDTQDYWIQHSNINLAPECDSDEGFVLLRVDEGKPNGDRPIRIFDRANCPLGEEEKAGFVMRKDGVKNFIQCKEPLKILPDQSIFVSCTYVNIRRMNDMVTLITKWPADNVKLRVVTSTDSRELEFFVDSAHRAGLERLDSPRHDHQLLEWQLGTALLPGQGIQLYWRRTPKHKSIPPIQAPAGKDEKKAA